jgi:hypothetical protein
MRLIVVEGTPEEMDQAPAWLRTLVDANGAQVTGNRQLALLNPAASRWFDEFLPDEEDESRRLAIEFLTVVQELGDDIIIHPGRSSVTANGMRAYLWAKRGSAKALFYFRPISGTVMFDLPPQAVRGLDRVEVRDRRGYRVRVILSDEESLQVAVELTRRAYEGAGRRAA